jgi:GNAT superfamily N-acetyltransferase
MQDSRGDGEGVTIELARPEDVAVLPEIEREAAALFSGLDLPKSVLESVCDLEDLVEALEEGLLWVARLGGGAPVGFALVELLDGVPHLDEMDVRPAFGRRGIGARLLGAVLAWARDAGHAEVTLSTFRDVPWNAPFYAKHGFRPMEEHEMSAALRANAAYETRRGLDPAARVTMRCYVGKVAD